MMRIHGKLGLCLTVILSCFLSACMESAYGESAKNDTETSWYHPVKSVKWQIQLKGKVKTDHDAELYDIDLFDTPVSVIEGLHASGKHVVCYFSAGSSENWREDFSKFNASDMGKPLKGWPGEKWLDVRSNNVREIMIARMDLAKEHGCDGVDPDNVDGYSNSPGFPLTFREQLEYNRFLATEAHKRNLAVGLKNDLDQVDALADVFDFSVNEQCFEFDECDKLEPFTEANKPVLNIEYRAPLVKDAHQREALCSRSKNAGLSTLILPLELDGQKFRYSCL